LLISSLACTIDTENAECTTLLDGIANVNRSVDDGDDGCVCAGSDRGDESMMSGVLSWASDIKEANETGGGDDLCDSCVLGEALNVAANGLLSCCCCCCCCCSADLVVSSVF